MSINPNRLFHMLRHKESGMFYVQSKVKSKSNLSHSGKIFQSKPSIHMIGNKYRHPILNDKGDPSAATEVREVIPSEWEVVSFKAIEESTHEPK